jgi:D-glycero-alpha-D-manno-heptose-7-phosphate kinase
MMVNWARVQAPVRVLDAGGWTDTWFAGHGAVCHLAVDHGSEVLVRRDDQGAASEIGSAELRVPAFGDRYRFAFDACPGRHPLLEATLRRWAPRGCAVDVSVTSSVPPGSSLGTSASVVVALIVALTSLGDRIADLATVARAAHEIETVDLQLQSGLQDQIAAAYGGANLVTIAAYPDVEVHPLDLAQTTWDGLAHRVVTVYLGAPHRSSAVHEAVTRRLAGMEQEPLLAPLRAAALAASRALVGGDIDAYGEAMIANTEAQAVLHPALVSPLARTVLAVAEDHGAVGWKVNGAGGEGGTVTIIGPTDPGRLLDALQSLRGATVLPLLPARNGARIVDHD